MWEAIRDSLLGSVMEATSSEPVAAVAAAFALLAMGWARRAGRAARRHEEQASGRHGAQSHELHTIREEIEGEREDIRALARDAKELRSSAAGQIVETAKALRKANEILTAVQAIAESSEKRHREVLKAVKPARRTARTPAAGGGRKKTPGEAATKPKSGAADAGNAGNE